MSQKGTIRLILVTAALAVALLLIWRPWQEIPRKGLSPLPARNDAACADVAARNSKPGTPEANTPENKPGANTPDATPGKPGGDTAKVVIPSGEKPPREPRPAKKAIEYVRVGNRDVIKVLNPDLVDSSGDYTDVRVGGQCAFEHKDEVGESPDTYEIEISGRTLNYSGTGEGGCEISAVILSWRREGDDEARRLSHDCQTTSSRSDKNGVYKLLFRWNEPAERATFVVLWARKPGFAESWVVGFSPTASGKEQVDLHLRLSARVLGTVVDGAGAGIAGVEVELSGGRETPEGWPVVVRNAVKSGNVCGQAKTDGSGQFAIADVAEGTHWIACMHRSYDSTTWTIQVPGASVYSLPEPIVMQSFQGVEFKVQGNDSKVERINPLVAVFYDASGKEVERGYVHPADGAGYAFRTTAQRLPAGTYRLDLSTEGSLSVSITEVVIVAGRITDLGTLQFLREK